MLVDPSARPEQFEEYSSRLSSSVQNAQPLQESAEKSPHVESLNRITDLCAEVAQSVDNKLDLWKQFCTLRNEISEKQDAAQDQHEVLKNKGLRPLNSIGNELQEIEVSTILGKLQVFKVRLTCLVHF